MTHYEKIKKANEWMHYHYQNEIAARIVELEDRCEDLAKKVPVWHNVSEEKPPYDKRVLASGELLPKGCEILSLKKGHKGEEDWWYSDVVKNDCVVRDLHAVEKWTELPRA